MTVLVVNRTRQKVLANQAEEALGFLDRFVGLMGRRQLKIGDGLILSPCNSIHTFFMRMPIDALFLDDEGVLVKAYQRLAPWRATGLHRAARSVVELPAGLTSSSGTQEGDLIFFERSANSL